jgi:hypothetical protein
MGPKSNISPVPCGVSIPGMEPSALRAAIFQTLSAGRLPQDSVRMWGGPGAGETCDACGDTITPSQLVMEMMALSDQPRSVQFHVSCFYRRDELRGLPRRVGTPHEAWP